MEKSKNKFSSSPLRHRFGSLDDFIFLAEPDDLDIESIPVPAKSPSKSALEEAMINGVISALTSVASKENLIMTSIAKAMLTGAATKLSTLTVAGVPGMAMGALIAGGIYAYRGFRNKSLTEIIRSLSPQHQKQLILRLGKGLKGLGITDLAQDILHRNEVRDVALTILSNFLSEKFNVKLTKT